jgi:hypothetical protein
MRLALILKFGYLQMSVVAFLKGILLPRIRRLKINLRILFTTKSKGQGFGLAVSKRLAKAMGEDPTFESEKGNSSKFTLKLLMCYLGVISFSSGIKSIEIEFTQCRTFFFVKPSPKNTCPKCAPQLAQVISVRTPSASKLRLTAPGISSSKLGHPQSDSNLFSER